MKIISWNINGIRAAAKKGLGGFMKSERADIFCFQEVKAVAEQVPEGAGLPDNYYSYWNSAERAGYSGIATYTKIEPKIIINGMENEDFDKEGRVLITKFNEFTLLNVYFPNGKMSKARLFYKMGFYEYFLKYVNNLRSQGEKIIFLGDVNTAHREMDLARPKENELISGFLKEERRWIDKVVENGYVDTFRVLQPNKVKYSWWSQRSRARLRNVGWRIDYVFVDESLMPKVKEAFILDEVMGSDHSPVGIEIEF